MNDFDKYISKGIVCTSKKQEHQFLLLANYYSELTSKKILKCITTKLFKKYSFEDFCNWYLFEFEPKKNIMKTGKTYLSKHEASNVLTKIFHKKVEVI